MILPLLTNLTYIQLSHEGLQTCRIDNGDLSISLPSYFLEILAQLPSLTHFIIYIHNHQAHHIVLDLAKYLPHVTHLHTTLPLTLESMGQLADFETSSQFDAGLVASVLPTVQS